MSNDSSTTSFEELDLAGPAPRKVSPGRRRTVAVIAAGALGATAVGGAVWAWRSFMQQGAQPAEALPANTLAYAALDLDPPGGQKVEAFKLLRKVPSIKKDLGLGSVDDLHESVVDEVASEGGCDLDYKAVKPWLGDRAAVAVVDQGKPQSVLVLQIDDAAKARRGLEKAASDCGFGFAVDGDWAVLARSEAVASRVVKDTDKAALNDDEDFRTLTGAAGDAGLITLYAAPEAGAALLDYADDDPFGGAIAMQAVTGIADPLMSFAMPYVLFTATFASADLVAGSDSQVSYEEPPVPPRLKKKQQRLYRQLEKMDELSQAEQDRLFDELQQLNEEIYGSDPEFADLEAPDELPVAEVDPALRASLKKFTGAGGIGRIANGGFELEVVADQLKGSSSDLYAGSKGGRLVDDLPNDTAFAFGAGLADGWADALFGVLHSQFSYTGDSEAEMVKTFEKSTGLEVPGDLDALGGDGVSLVAGSGLDLEKGFSDPARTQVGARIAGDPDKIEAALTKVRAGMGRDGGSLLSKRVGDGVVVSANADYLDDLAKAGSLGGTDAFDDVVPDAKGATSVVFVNFDAGDWLVKGTSGDDRADAKPFRALGMSVTRHDGKQHIRIRLGFDD